LHQRNFSERRVFQITALKLPLTERRICGNQRGIQFERGGDSFTDSPRDSSRSGTSASNRAEIKTAGIKAISRVRATNSANPRGFKRSSSEADRRFPRRASSRRRSGINLGFVQAGRARPLQCTQRAIDYRNVSRAARGCLERARGKGVPASSALIDLIKFRGNSSA
jgi:hypothetical protein